MAGNTSSPNEETSPLLSHSENGHEADNEATAEPVELVAAKSFPAVDPPPESLPAQAGECISYQWPPPAAVEPDALDQAVTRLAENLTSGGGNEGTDPFPKEANLTPGLVRRGIKLQQVHDDLLLQARMLLVLLGHEAEDHIGDFDMIRRRFELLLRGLRQYEVGEKDLIFDSVCLEIGTGD
jgi:hypothetical protein